MKTTIFTLLFVLCATLAFSQAKKPTIMVVPSDAWCNSNGYMMEFDNQGTTVKIPDYTNALLNEDLNFVIGKIGTLMTARGFSLKDLKLSLKTLADQSSEDAMLTSKDGGAVNESPIDKLKKIAKADIWIQITWTVNKSGPDKSLTFSLLGFDAYTDKQIAGASGTGEPSSASEIPILLEEAVLAHIDNFNTQLQAHFDELFANGREIILRIKTWDTFDGNLESDYGGKELGTVIEEWVSSNTVQGRFNTSDATENMMLFEQVRIPLYDAANKAIDARGWAKGLQKYLKDTHAIESKLMMKGLGQAQLVIGGK